MPYLLQYYSTNLEVGILCPDFFLTHTLQILKPACQRPSTGWEFNAYCITGMATLMRILLCQAIVLLTIITAYPSFHYKSFFKNAYLHFSLLLIFMLRCDTPLLSSAL